MRTCFFFSEIGCLGKNMNKNHLFLGLCCFGTRSPPRKKNPQPQRRGTSEGRKELRALSQSSEIWRTKLAFTGSGGGGTTMGRDPHRVFPVVNFWKPPPIDQEKNRFIYYTVLLGENGGFISLYIVPNKKCFWKVESPWRRFVTMLNFESYTYTFWKKTSIIVETEILKLDDPTFEEMLADQRSISFQISSRSSVMVRILCSGRCWWLMSCSLS